MKITLDQIVSEEDAKKLEVLSEELADEEGGQGTTAPRRREIAGMVTPVDLARQLSRDAAYKQRGLRRPKRA